MEVAELMEGVEKMADVVSKAEIIVGEFPIETVLDSANDELVRIFDENPNLTTQLEMLEINPADIKIDSVDGDLQLSLNERKVNLEESLTKMYDEGDLTGSLKELGVDDEVLNDPEIRMYSRNYKIGWNQQTGISDILEQQRSQEETELVSDLPDPENVEEMTDILLENPGLHRTMQRRLAQLEKVTGDTVPDVIVNDKVKVNVGKWVKRTAIVTLGTIALAEMFILIKNHNASVNGCWLVNKTSGQKCKVLCSHEHMEGTGGVEFCSTDCTNSDSLCLLDNPKKCGMKCKPYCNRANVKASMRHLTMVCVQVNFWEAARDLTKSEKPLMSDAAASKLELKEKGFFVKYRVMIVIAIILVIIIFIVLK